MGQVTVAPDGISRGHVILPHEGEQFNDFIRSLLGSPQSITRDFVGSFEVTRDDISHLDSLLTQRIQQQNRATLVNFSARVVMEDGTTVLLNDLRELLSYNEVKPLISVGLHISWTYLVQFEDKQAPERQIISISFGQGEVAVKDMELRGIRVNRIFGTGAIHIAISHTARTWAADIEALMSNFVKGMITIEHGFRRWLSSHSGNISLVVGAMVFLLSMGSYVFYQYEEKADLLMFVQDEISSSSLGSVEDKIDIILEVLPRISASGFDFIVALAVGIASTIVSILAGTFLGDNLKFYDVGLVLFSKEAVKLKERHGRRERNAKLKIMASLAGALIVGLISNYIFSILTPYL